MCWELWSRICLHFQEHWKSWGAGLRMHGCLFLPSGQQGYKALSKAAWMQPSSCPLGVHSLIVFFNGSPGKGAHREWASWPHESSRPTVLSKSECWRKTFDCARAACVKEWVSVWYGREGGREWLIDRSCWEKKARRVEWVRFTPLFFPFWNSLCSLSHTHTQQPCTCSEMCENHLKCVKCGPFESMLYTHILLSKNGFVNVQIFLHLQEFCVCPRCSPDWLACGI